MRENMFIKNGRETTLATIGWIFFIIGLLTDNLFLVIPFRAVARVLP